MGGRNIAASHLARCDEIVGGIVGEVWMTVLFIQFFWIEAVRGKGTAG